MYFLLKMGDIPASYVSLPKGIEPFQFPCQTSMYSMPAGAAISPVILPGLSFPSFTRGTWSWAVVVDVGGEEPCFR